jgi:sensor histidine kinase regulating citrate/malate metabolism
VIVGNLLENAVDALRDVDPDRRYLTARAGIINGMLSIIVENRFDGTYHKKNGRYISRKITGNRREGIGLSSVKAICERHGGFVRIEPECDIWRVSALVELGGASPPNAPK